MTAIPLNQQPCSPNQATALAIELAESTRAHARVEIIGDLQAWNRNRAAIDDLLSTTSHASPQSTTIWLREWWKAFADDRSLRIGLFWQDDRLVGYAPLMLVRERLFGIPQSVLRLIGDGVSDYGDLFSRDDRSDVMQEMVDDIVERWTWDELNLLNVRAGSPTIAAFRRRQSIQYFSRVAPIDRCLYIDLRGRTFEQYYRSLSRNHRRELQKRRHKLDALGTWSVRFEPDAPTSALFDEFRSLHTARCTAMGWSSAYDLPGFREFFASVMQSGPKDIEVLCSTLRHGERLISYTLGFVARGVYHHWNIGFDPVYEAIAPNKLHHQFLIEECFRRGYVEFDFMRGAYPYKFKWTDRLRENYGIRFLRRHGWRRALNHLAWFQERERDSLAWRVIDGTRSAMRALRPTTAKVPEQNDE